MIGSNSKNEFGNNEVSNNKVIKKKNYQKIFKSKKMLKSITLGFFTLEVRLAFTKLR